MKASTQTPEVDRGNMVLINGGSFLMGSDKFYPEEKPVHKVTVGAFYMDKFEVTNADFQKFADKTGYLTVAERPLNPADYPGANPELLVPGAVSYTHLTLPTNREV